MEFIGRETWIDHFEAYREQAGTVPVWGIKGQPGIGKSRLLNQFVKRCKEAQHPHVHLSMESYTPQTGDQVLKDFVRAARDFTPLTEDEQFKKAKRGKSFSTLIEALMSTLGLAATAVEPTAAIAIGVARIAVRLGSDLTEDEVQEIEKEAAEHPERFLLESLSKFADQKPVCLIDTYEHIVNDKLKIKTRLIWDENGEVGEGLERDVELYEWLGDLLDYLRTKGWRIVITGRHVLRIHKGCRIEPLGYFSDNEIISAAKTNDDLREYVDSHQDSLRIILKDLSFKGNPLWLQVAMNLLEILLKEGEDIDALAKNRDKLHATFEEKGNVLVDRHEETELRHCKLAMIHRIFGEKAKQVWRIALPRVLDERMVRILFNKKYAGTIQEEFNESGMFRKDGEQFALHEEIRDLLLAYARSEGFLDKQKTRELHGRLWTYLNETNFEKLPPEWRGIGKLIEESKSHNGVISIEGGLHTEVQHPQIWMWDAAYHRIMSFEKLPGETTVTPKEFWLATGGSASLSAPEKWRIAKELSDLASWQINELMRTFSDELGKWEEIFGKETALALQEENLTGNTNAIHDLGFWKRRVQDHHLAGDYTGLIAALMTYGEYTQAIQYVDGLLDRYGDSKVPEVQTQCAKAMVNKGITLGERLGQPEEEIKTYTKLWERYGDSKVPEVQTQCAKAMVNKGFTLGERLGQPEEAIETCTKLWERYGDSKVPEVQTQCAKAMVNKGVALGEKLGQPEEEIKTYTELWERYGDSKVPEEVQTICAKAMVIKGITLGERLGQPEEEIKTYTKLWERYGDSTVPDVQTICAKAMVIKGITLGERLGQPEEEIKTYTKLWERYGDSKVTEVQTECAKAMLIKGITLGERLGQPEEEIKTYTELWERYGDSTVPDVQTICAKAMVIKGITLGERLGQPEEEIKTYTELWERYGDSTVPDVQTECAKAMVNKGVTLGERLGQPEEEIETYTKLWERYGDSKVPEVQTQCAKAMVNKGVTLGERLGQPEEAIETYAELLEHYGDSKVTDVQTQCAMAMVNKGITLGKRLDQPEEAVETYTELWERYGDSKVPEVQTQCAKAMVNKGFTLGKNLDQPKEAVETYTKLWERYGDSTVPDVQTQCAKAMVIKGFTLGERLDQPEEGVETYTELWERYGDSKVPEVQTQCLSAQRNVIEPLLVLGQNEQALSWIAQVRAEVSPADQESAIMVFLSWLAEPATSRQEVLDAIHALTPDVRFTWNFNLLRRSLLPRLSEPRKTQARCFMDFFEQDHDVAQLESCLVPTESA
ncbi:hypothetical protein FACS189488_07550 [Betaproteobacteria bacterium]|nr:hypothetical protein FACS189488_07550 [Betaproteobacteria bacterium]